MLFSKIFTTGAVMAATACAALTPSQLADGIRSITQKSQALQAPAQSITIVNAPLIVIGQGPFPKLIAGFTDIVTTATVVISQAPGTPKITKPADATLVFDVFREVRATPQKPIPRGLFNGSSLHSLPVLTA
jgi:hypothetical protein